MPLQKEQLKKDTEKTVVISSLERLLKDCAYSCRRPRKGVPAAAPSKEEKLARVQETAAEILKLKKDSDADVFFVDESHFSTAPYVVRGWYRGGEDFFPRDKSQPEVNHQFRRIQTADKIFLLEIPQNKFGDGKPCVCSLPKAVRGTCEEIISRIRQVIGAWTFGKLAVNPQTGIGIRQNLCFNSL